MLCFYDWFDTHLPAETQRLQMIAGLLSDPNAVPNKLLGILYSAWCQHHRLFLNSHADGPDVADLFPFAEIQHLPKAELESGKDWNTDIPYFETVRAPLVEDDFLIPRYVYNGWCGELCPPNECGMGYRGLLRDRCAKGYIQTNWESRPEDVCEFIRLVLAGNR